MDESTKAMMLERCETIEQDGLTYQQEGINKNSKHFDLTPLINTLQDYVNGFDNWEDMNHFDAIRAAWMNVGLAQRDLPVHVINEYCRRNRSLDLGPAFNEDELPREMSYYNYSSNTMIALFPLIISSSSGLGVDFALRFRGWNHLDSSMRSDLAAISQLDTVRTDDLKQSLVILGKPPELGHAMSMP